MEENRIIEDFYDINIILGHGGFSTVRKAVHKETGRAVAIKVIDLKKVYQLTLEETGEEEDPVIGIKEEIEIMSILKHQNIVEYYESFQTAETYYLVMELLSGGELLDIVTEKERLPPDTAAVVLKQLLCGVEYMHGQGIVHRDLKLENLLLDEPRQNVKISDFGLSKNFLIERPSKCVGSPLYVAPEVLVSETYDNAVDIWSVGVMAFMLVGGCPPFDSPEDNEMEIFEKICKGEYTFEAPEWMLVSDEIKHFIGSILVLDASQRPTATLLLSHSWLTSDHLPETLSF